MGFEDGKNFPGHVGGEAGDLPVFNSDPFAVGAGGYEMLASTFACAQTPGFPRRGSHRVRHRGHVC